MVFLSFTISYNLTKILYKRCTLETKLISKDKIITKYDTFCSHEGKSEISLLIFAIKNLELSILIPIYNQQVDALIEQLIGQLELLQIESEIICLEDGSTRWVDANRRVAHSHGIQYSMQENVGRSASRNRLGEMAAGEWLLFLDCDSLIPSPHFIKMYLEVFQKGKVIYGGTTYPERPRDPSLLLHWKYGTFVEAAPFKKRMKTPFLSFKTNNFLVHSSIWNNLPLDEKITQYGYEDLIWALELEKQGIQIHHIDNPVVHGGLETTTVFLKKTAKALSNLESLVHSGKLDGDETPLLRAHQKIRKFGLSPLFQFIFWILNPLILHNLHSKNPSLTLFNLWKLRKYIETAKSNAV